MTDITVITAEDRLADSKWYVDAEGCWIWLGKYNGGRAKLGSMSAARAMWIAHYGHITSELLEVCHACHNPACVNINHLYVANHARNMADTGTAGPVLPFARFIAPSPAVRDLTDNDLKRIEYLQRSRLLTTRELALVFNVTTAKIRKALNSLKGVGNE